MTQEITNDPAAELYFNGFKKADELLYRTYGNYYIVFPQLNNIWTNDMFCFDTEDEMLQFCNKLNIKPTKDVFESETKPMNKHTIPIGTLVEIKHDEEFENEKNDDYRKGIRMFVVRHSFDCDGSPLYDLSFDITAAKTIDDIERELAKTPSFNELFDPMFTTNRKALETIKQWNFGRIDKHYGEESLTVIQ